MISINSRYKELMSSEKWNDKFNSIVGANTIFQGMDVSVYGVNVSVSPGRCLIRGAMIDDGLGSAEKLILPEYIDENEVNVYIEYNHASSSVQYYLAMGEFTPHYGQLVLAQLIVSNGTVEEIIPADKTPTMIDMYEMIKDLLFAPIVITSITNNRNVVEKGEVLNGAILNWSLSKGAKRQCLNNVDIDKRATSYSDTSSISTNKTYTLQAFDEKGSSTKSTSIMFYNGIYYGAYDIDYDIQTITQSLAKVLSDGKGRTVTINCSDNKYIYYILPKRLGTCSFKVNGFDGGFDLVDETSYTNSKGFTEDYFIYRSVNHSLGSTTMIIS